MIRRRNRLPEIVANLLASTTQEQLQAVIGSGSSGGVSDGNKGDVTVSGSGTSWTVPGLAGKANTSHTHTVANVTGLQTALDGKQAAGSYAAASHTHAIADVTGLQTALDGKTQLYSLAIMAANAATTTDAQTLFFGAIAAVAPSTTAGNARVYCPYAGTIIAADIFAHAGTAGSNEAWPLYIRLNNTTDTLIQSLSLSSSQRRWSNTSLGITVAAGDWFEIKSINPTWVAANPANVRFSGTVIVQRS